MRKFMDLVMFSKTLQNFLWPRRLDIDEIFLSEKNAIPELPTNIGLDSLIKGIVVNSLQY